MTPELLDLKDTGATVPAYAYDALLRAWQDLEFESAELRDERNKAKQQAERDRRAFKRASLIAFVMFLVAAAGWLRVWGIF